MSKGHMLYVEGGEFPKKVHRTHRSAFRELHRLAAMNPGKKVYMLQLTDRYVYEGEGPAKTVGTHLPADERMVVDETDLVTGKSLKAGVEKFARG